MHLKNPRPRLATGIFPYMRAILAGGGTGGHVIPALAIAQCLKQTHQAEVLFIGTQHGIENRLVPAAGFQLRRVQMGALKNVSVKTRAKTALDLPRAIWACWRLLADFQPDVMIGVGGYASGPAMLVAALSSVPTVAFEPNVIPGFANRLVAPMVSQAAVHFEESGRYFRRFQVTGVPVRHVFFEIAGKRTGDRRPTLLVFGGSQGAHAINRILIHSLAPLRAAVADLHIIHQTGERDYNDAQAAYLESGGSAEVYPFIDDMPGMFARADLVLCRSGASTVAEIAAAGRPAIFVPLPHAADDHQKRNAQALERAGAATVVEESNLTPQHLAETVAILLRDRARREKMSAAARMLAHPHADREIAAMAARLAGEA